MKEFFGAVHLHGDLDLVRLELKLPGARGGAKKISLRHNPRRLIDLLRDGRPGRRRLR